MAREPEHVAQLTPDDRRRLTRLVRSGRHPARAVTHARILLKADAAAGRPGWNNAVSDEAVRRTPKNDPKPWQAAVGHPAEGERGVRGGDGGRAGGVPPAAVRRPPGGGRGRGRQATRRRRPAAAGPPEGPAKEDSEYVRHGVANPFLAFEPPAGWRHVEATDRRTSVDFARFLRRLVDEPYPDAEKVVPVLDNPSTRTPAAPYHAFDPAEARRLADRLEWHNTPKHGSWPNVAGCELPVLARQCPDRRIPDPEVLRREVAAWERDRNAAGVTADWQFATADVRTRLKKLYPVTGPDT